MEFTEKYKPLFRLHLLHNFHLANGEEAYNHTKLPNTFSSYSFKEFAKILPTKKTAKHLKNYKILIQETSTGIIAFIKADDSSKSFIEIDKLELEFLLYIKDPLFEKYTKLKSNKKQLYHFKYKKRVRKKKIDRLVQAKASPIEDFAVPFDSDENSEYQILIKNMEASQRVSLFGIISLDVDKMLRRNKVPKKEKQFKIVFESKELTWVYFNSEDKEVFRTNKKLPFIKNGTIKVMDNSANFYRMALPNDLVELDEAKIYV